MIMKNVHFTLALLIFTALLFSGKSIYSSDLDKQAGFDFKLKEKYSHILTETSAGMAFRKMKASSLEAEYQGLKLEHYHGLRTSFVNRPSYLMDNTNSLVVVKNNSFKLPSVASQTQSGYSPYFKGLLIGGGISYLYFTNKGYESGFSLLMACVFGMGTGLVFSFLGW